MKPEKVDKTEPEKIYRTEPKEWRPTLIKCPTCKSSISINAQACPKCGETLTEEIRQEIIKKEKESAKKLRKTLVVIGVILLTIILLSKIFPDLSKNTSSLVSVPQIDVRGATIYKGQSADSVFGAIGSGYLSYSQEDPTNPNSLWVSRSYDIDGKKFYILFCRETDPGNYVVCSIQIPKEDNVTPEIYKKDSVTP